MGKKRLNTLKTPLLATTLILLICFIVFKDYLLFEKAYFFKGVGSDTINAYYPFVYHVTSYIAKYGLPKWSFNLGMGQSLFPLSLDDPFYIFLYAGNKDHIFYGMVYKEVAKILLSGLIFFYYLRTLKLSRYTSVAGSLLYAFCGFMIVGSCWNLFSFEALNMALLLLSFELLFTRKNWYLFPLPVFLICISQPFNLYLYGVFLCAYAILRHIQTNTFTLKNAGLFFVKMIGLAILGMLLSAPFLLENVLHLFESPRGSGNNSYAHILSRTPVFTISDKIQIGTGVMRFFSNDLVGNGTTYNAWKNFLEAPLFYCGLPCLLLMPQIFQFLEKKIKIIFIVFLAIWFLPFFFPYLRYAFWLFTGNYYRAYSLFVAFFMMYYSLYALESITQKRKINLTVLISTVLALFMLLHYPFFPDILPYTDPARIRLNHSILLFVSIALVVYGVLLYFMSRQNAPAYVKYIFMAAVVTELIYLCSITVNNMEAITAQEWGPKKNYADYTIDAVNYLKQTDHSFYRIDKTYSSSPSYFPTLNDGMAQDYRGTSSYNAFNQKYYILYLQLMGIANRADESESRWAIGLANRPVLESENRVKYILVKNAIDPLLKATSDSVFKAGDVTVYRNKYVLPFGFTYKYYIRESVFNNLSSDQKDFVSLKACALNDQDINKTEGLKEFQLNDTFASGAFDIAVYKQDIDDLSKDALTIEKFDDNLFIGKTNLSEDKIMYLSIPYDDDWKLTVDGQPAGKIILDGGMTGIMLKKGQHTIALSYDLRFFSKGLLLSLLGLLIYLGIWVYTRKTRGAN